MSQRDRKSTLSPSVISQCFKYLEKWCNVIGISSDSRCCSLDFLKANWILNIVLWWLSPFLNDPAVISFFPTSPREVQNTIRLYSSRQWNSNSQTILLSIFQIKINALVRIIWDTEMPPNYHWSETCFPSVKCFTNFEETQKSFDETRAISEEISHFPRD